MKKTIRLWICLCLSMVLLMSNSSVVEAKEKKEITKSNVNKIVKDIGEYLTERCMLGSKETKKLKFDLHTKTQMACKISKTYEKNKIVMIDPKDKNFKLCYSSLKEKEIKKNAQNLFGSNKIKFEPYKFGVLSYIDGNIDALKWKNKIIVSDLGGFFRYEGAMEYKVKIKKISGKNTKKVVIDCGIMGYEGQEAKKKEYINWATYTLTLKPANNKYGCIITNIKENWMMEGNAFIG